MSSVGNVSAGQEGGVIEGPGRCIVRLLQRGPTSASRRPDRANFGGVGMRRGAVDFARTVWHLTTVPSGRVSIFGLGRSQERTSAQRAPGEDRVDAIVRGDFDRLRDGPDLHAVRPVHHRDDRRGGRAAVVRRASRRRNAGYPARDWRSGVLALAESSFRPAGETESATAIASQNSHSRRERQLSRAFIRFSEGAQKARLPIDARGVRILGLTTVAASAGADCDDGDAVISLIGKAGGRCRFDAGSRPIDRARGNH